MLVKMLLKKNSNTNLTSKIKVDDWFAHTREDTILKIRDCVK